MSARIDIQNLLPNANLTCYVIPGLFSLEECGNLLNSEIKNSFEKAHSNYPTYYRNNDRFVVDDNFVQAVTVIDESTLLTAAYDGRIQTMKIPEFTKKDHLKGGLVV